MVGVKEEKLPVGDWWLLLLVSIEKVPTWLICA